LIIFLLSIFVKNMKLLQEGGGWLDSKSVDRYTHIPTEEVQHVTDSSPLNRAKPVQLLKAKK
jgi:hypothetical protein